MATKILSTFTQSDGAGFQADVFERELVYASQGAHPYGVRFFDTDSGETVTITFFPTYEAAVAAAKSATHN
jgi:hypothetical protein